MVFFTSCHDINGVFFELRATKSSSIPTVKRRLASFLGTFGGAGAGESLCCAQVLPKVGDWNAYRFAIERIGKEIIDIIFLNKIDTWNSLSFVCNWSWWASHMTDYTVLYCSTCAGLLRVLLIDWKYFGERHFVPTLSHLWRGLKGEKRRPNWRKITCNASVVLMKSHHESLLLIGPPPKKWGSAGPEAMRCGPYFRRIYFLKNPLFGLKGFVAEIGKQTSLQSLNLAARCCGLRHLDKLGPE